MVSIFIVGELVGGNINISIGKIFFIVGDIMINGFVGVIIDGNLIILLDCFLFNKFNFIDI